MIICRIYKIFDVPLHDGAYVTIVSDKSETIGPSGRRRGLFFTPEEWIDRLATKVSPENHCSHGYKPCCDGIRYAWFRYGSEGRPDKMLGPATAEEREYNTRYQNEHRDQINEYYWNDPDYHRTYQRQYARDKRSKSKEEL